MLGVDASRAVTDAPTGTEYYARALIEALLTCASEFSFRLYTRTTPPPKFFPPTGNYEIRTIPLPRLWTHLRLSYEMLTRPPGALFVPSHVVPLIHPKNSIVTIHDLGYKFFPGAHPVLQRIYLDVATRWNAKAARIVIADSEATRKDLQRLYGVPREKIRVVYPAYNAEVFQPVGEAREIERVRAEYALGASPYLISVGTLQPRKNYLRLIEASAALPEEYILVIVGKRGWLFETILQRARELNIEARVKFLDYVPIKDLPVLYGDAQLAVFPSLYEGFGFPALEAQACGTPLVCSNTSSLPEVAGEGAVYFDPQKTEEMTRAIRGVLGDEARRQRLIQNGLANVARFSWERTARAVLEIVRGF